MIEIIFVIVILGILAAVAVPRLAATRDDATSVVIGTNLKRTVNEYVSLYNIHRVFPVMTDACNQAGATGVCVPFVTGAVESALQTNVSGGLAFGKVGTNCGVFSVGADANGNFITINYTNSANCPGLQNLLTSQFPANSGVANVHIIRL